MTTKHPTLLPDTTLFIYYLEGRLEKGDHLEASSYVGNWEEDGFSFLFFTEKSETKIQKLLSKFPHLTLLDTFEMTNEEWQGGKLTPMLIGKLLFRPLWTKIPEFQQEVIEILLDPGVVFGNGMHPTTRDCIEAIEFVCSGKKITTMLDLGTGTGILALTAAKLGCEKVVAVDFNFLAAQTAQNNFAINNLQNNIVVINGRAEEFSNISSDLLVANIHYDVMKDLVQSKGFSRQKWFILSGLLQSESIKILDYLATQKVLIIKVVNQKKWCTIIGITDGS